MGGYAEHCPHAILCRRLDDLMCAAIAWNATSKQFSSGKLPYNFEGGKVHSGINAFQVGLLALGFVRACVESLFFRSSMPKERKTITKAHSRVD